MINKTNVLFVRFFFVVNIAIFIHFVFNRSRKYNLLGIVWWTNTPHNDLNITQLMVDFANDNGCSIQLFKWSSLALYFDYEHIICFETKTIHAKSHKILYWMPEEQIWNDINNDNNGKKRDTWEHYQNWIQSHHRCYRIYICCLLKCIYLPYTRQIHIYGIVFLLHKSTIKRKKAFLKSR